MSFYSKSSLILLSLLILGAVIQTFVSCTLNFPEEPELTSSSSEDGTLSSSSNVINAGTVIFDNAPSEIARVNVFNYNADIKTADDLSEFRNFAGTPIGLTITQANLQTPITLTTVTSEPFTRTGDFLVRVDFGTEERYYSKVTFVNGGARINWSENYFDGINYVTGGGSSSSRLLSSSSSTGGSSSSDDSNSSSSFENISSSSSDGGSSSSSGDDILSSSSNIIQSSSSSLLSSSSSGGGSSSSSLLPSSSSIGGSLSSSGGCTANDNSQTQYCSGGVMKTYGTISDSRSNKTYKTVEIGNQTWMAENLNYEPTSGKHRCFAQGNGNGVDDWLQPSQPDQPNRPHDDGQIKANCDKYGRLYDWATAMNLPQNCNTAFCKNQIQSKHQGVCPSGWHIPSKDEWLELKDYVYKILWDNYEDEDFGWDVGTKLKSINGWENHDGKGIMGVDSYGFGAIGSGYCVSCDKLTDGSGFFAGISITWSNTSSGQSINKIGEGTEAHWWSSSEYENQYMPNDGTRAYKNKITYNKNTMTQEFELKSDYLYSVRCLRN